MNNLLKTIIKDFHKSLPKSHVRNRKLQVPLDSNKIISLIGPRRSGKTFYSFQLINELFSRYCGKVSSFKHPCT
jgi:predicted AAA+ superfamily ATPase